MEDGRFITVCPLAEIPSPRVLQNQLLIGNANHLSHLQTQSFMSPLIIPPPQNFIINPQLLTTNQSSDAALSYHQMSSQCPTLLVHSGSQDTLSNLGLHGVGYHVVTPPSPQDVGGLVSSIQFSPHQLQIIPASPLLLSNSNKDTSTLPPMFSYSPVTNLLQKPANENSCQNKLLENLKNKPNIRLSDLAGNFVEMSKDQYGSRFLQQKMEGVDEEEMELLISEILSSTVQLSMDVFGNYVVQKIFQVGGFTSELKDKIIENARVLAFHTYGCRVVQKALEVLQESDKCSLMKKLDQCFVECCNDQSGNHVVQKAIEYLNNDNVRLILKHFKGHVVSMSCHLYACRVIQRCLEHVLEQCKFILDEVLSNLKILMKDQYGNYVVQYVVEKGSAEEKERIFSSIEGEVVMLSQHKYASNVIEKCILHSSDKQRSRFFDEVCSSSSISVESTLNSLEALADNLFPSNKSSQKQQSASLDDMLKDQFGNYVIQKMLDVADEHQGKMLVSHIKPHLASLKTFAYGKYILAKLEKCKSKCDESKSLTSQESVDRADNNTPTTCPPAEK